MTTRFLLLSSLYILLLSSCQNLGKEIDYGNLELFYKDGATQEEAQKLGEFLIKNDFWKGKEGKMAMQLTKDGAIYKLNVPVKKEMEHDLQYRYKVAAFASTLSEQVFDGAKIDIRLCDDKMEVKSVVGMDHQIKLQTYQHDNYAIEYPIDWKLKQQKGFDFLLESPISYHYVQHYNDMTLNVVNLADLDVTSIDGLLQKLVNIAANVKANDGAVREILQKTTGTKNGLEFAKVIYNIEQDDDTVRLTGVLYKAGKKCYLLTARAGQETLNKHDYEKTEAAIFNSFEVKQ